MFKYAVEHSKDFAEFYNYMADIAYGKAFDDVRKKNVQRKESEIDGY